MLVKSTVKSTLLGGLTREKFLRDYWQKKPLLVRGAFPGFVDPITPEELAGLSCEDGIESRVVVRGTTNKNKNKTKKSWQVTYGPQEESIYTSLADTNWTVLVQEVNRWVPEAALLLLEPFAFIPNVRVDDVMVSYATPGGGVGPHVDSYDVFLVQGQGERRWQFHEQKLKSRGRKRSEDESEFVPNIDLRVLAKFIPDVDEVLEPGDMLYLPPGVAHHGVAETPCLTYSIGFRAPSAGEMWTSFATQRATRDEARASALLEDPPLTPAGNPGAIPPKMLERVRTMIRSMDTKSNDAIDRWFASFATQLKPGHDFTPPTKRPNNETITKRLARGDVVVRSEEGRWAYLKEGSLLYLGGRELDVGADSSARNLVRSICAARRHDGRVLKQQAKTLPARQLLFDLFALGALQFT